MSTPLFQVTQRGDFVMIGNTLAQDTAVSVPQPTVGTVEPSSDTGATRDTSPDVYWRADNLAPGQATAAASISPSQARTTAQLNIPTGGTVTKAFLFWSSNGPPDATVTIERSNTFTSIVTATGIATGTLNGGATYMGWADVTDIVVARGSGAYRISGVSGLDVRNQSNDTLYSGWSLYVLYENPSDKLRQLTLLNPFAAVENGANFNDQITGFVAPPTGIEARVGITAFEGDASTAGDTLSLNGQLVSNGQNPVNNIFNSSRSTNGIAVSNTGDLPQTPGNPGSLSGIDLDIFDFSGNVPVGSTSATVTATGGADRYIVGAMMFSVTASGAPDILGANGANDILIGTKYNERLIGFSGNDIIYGLEDDDVLLGGDGDDTLHGGSGADLLDGGAGFDYASYSNANGSVTGRLDIPSQNLGEAAGDTFIDIEGLIGSQFQDVIVGDLQNNVMRGGEGNDTIHGQGGSDLLYGEAGNDLLIGGPGADTLDGGAGFDFASYTDAASGIVARLDFAAGLFGEANGDSYTFSGGLLTIEGVIGSNFADTIIGDGAANGIYGGGGNDVILGLGGSDGIFGDFGNDTLFGGRGADYLVGGNGAPVPAGQTDNDVFAFVSADTEAGVYDTIIDFHDGEDAILLQGFGYTSASRPVLIDVAYGPNIPATVISFGGGTAGVTVVGITSSQLQGAPAAGGDWVLY